MIRFFCLKHFATLKHNGNVGGTGIFHKTWKRDLFSFFPHMENQLSSDHLMNNPFFTTDLKCQLCNILGFNICVGLSGLSVLFTGLFVKSWAITILPCYTVHLRSSEVSWQWNILLLYANIRISLPSYSKNTVEILI